MKVIASLILCFFANIAIAQADVYQVRIKNVSENVYISQEGYIIATRNCNENIPQFEDVVLVYPKESFLKKHTLIFTSKTRYATCEIKSIDKTDSFPTIQK